MPFAKNRGEISTEVATQTLDIPYNALIMQSGDILQGKQPADGERQQTWNGL